MTITPEMLAAADAIDVKMYEGHTPWPWHADSPVRVQGGGYDVYRVCPIPFHLTDRDSAKANTLLGTDAVLLPVVIRQRDEARAQVETVAGKLATVIAERDAMREKCRQLLLLAGVQEATIDEALAPPKDEPRREEE